MESTGAREREVEAVDRVVRKRRAMKRAATTRARRKVSILLPRTGDSTVHGFRRGGKRGREGHKKTKADGNGGRECLVDSSRHV